MPDESKPVRGPRCRTGAQGSCGSAFVALAFGLLAWAPDRAAAEPVELAGGALRVDVSVEVGDATSEASGVASWPESIANHNPDLAQQLTAGPGRERWVEVEITGKYLEFQFRVVPMRDGEAVGGRGDWVECKCGSDELLRGINEKIAAAIQRLREPVVSAEVEAPAHEDRPPGPPPRQIVYRKMTGLGTAGIVVGALGLSGMITGGVFLGIGERVPEDRQHVVRDFHSSGVAMLVSGGVLLGAGVAMLVTDVLQCRKEHRRCAIEAEGGAEVAGRRWILGPWLGGRVVGLAGRF